MKIIPGSFVSDADASAWADARDRRQTWGESSSYAGCKPRKIGPAKLPKDYDGRLTRRLRELRANPTPLSELPADYWSAP